MYYDNVLEAIGNTPLIKLERIPDARCARILVKFEALNVGGSIKTRTALNMIEQAERRGEIEPGKTLVIEPTSGNQGIGLALVGAVRGYDVRIVMPDSVSVERRKICEAYGARIELVHDDGDIGKAITECARIAREQATADPRAWMPNQFSNPDNVAIQHERTAREILEDAPGVIDGFACGFGTGGSISGIGNALKEANPDTVVWAAEPENAALLAGGNIGTHLQMGIGDGIIPDILDRSVIDATCVVSDEEAIDMARRLAREEGLLCGISSGTNVAAAVLLGHELGPDATVVTILTDTGERYFSTPLFDQRMSSRTSSGE